MVYIQNASTEIKRPEEFSETAVNECSVSGFVNVIYIHDIFQKSSRRIKFLTFVKSMSRQCFLKKNQKWKFKL